MDKYLLVGGTGTLGQAMTALMLDKDVKPEQIYCFSRDELKQQQLKRYFKDINYIIGDITDYDSIYDAIHQNDITHVFHFAALKHIDVFEENVMRGIKVNVGGLENCAQAAMQSPHVKRFIFSSTDKAVLPINAYGFAKALGEKYLENLNRIAAKHDKEQKCMIFRWGNILGSRGSVIHSFAETIKKERQINLTDQAMTRFWIPIEEAANFMFNMSTVTAICPGNKIFIPPNAKAYKVEKLAELIGDVIGVHDYKIALTGLRAGEKIHECLLSTHEECLRSDTAPLWDKLELRKEIAKCLRS